VRSTTAWDCPTNRSPPFGLAQLQNGPDGAAGMDAGGRAGRHLVSQPLALFAGADVRRTGSIAVVAESLGLAELPVIGTGGDVYAFKRQQ
jgi:hypothetical protein